MFCRLEENNVIAPENIVIIGNYFLDDEVVTEEKKNGKD